MLVAISAFSQGFTPGNLVVYRYGDGSAPMANSTLVPVFLDEYTPAGVLVGTKVIPTVADGANKPMSGLARVSTGLYQQEGISTISSDGKYITIIGYNQTPGAAIPATSDGFVVGVIAADGSYNSTTTLSNEASTGLGSPRSAIIKGTDIWANGYQNGVQYTTLGASGSTRVSVGQNAPRTLTMFGDAIYAPIGNSGNLASADPAPGTSTTFSTISFGSPTPTTNQVMVFMINGVYRLYVADDAANLIRRYYLNTAGTSWVVDGTVSSAPATAFVKSITIVQSESGANTLVDVYATTWGNDGSGIEASKLIKFTDTYSTASPKNPPTTSAVAVLATAPANTLFRSVTPAPVNSAAIGTVVLPINLKSFNAGVDGGKVNIWWSTFNEVNVKDFTVERSTDAVNFDGVGTVAARNSIQLSSYTFTDAHPNATVLYYRLKVTDKDGSVTYSAVIKVSLAVAARVSVAPNPAAGSNINVSHAKAGKDAVIRLFSFDGKLIRSIPVQQGATQSLVEVAQLVKGNYIVEFADASARSTATFIKQ